MTKTKNSKEKKEKKPKDKINYLVFAVILIALAIILFLGFIDLAGIVGQLFSRALRITFGWASWLVPFETIILAYFLLSKQKTEKSFLKVLLGLILVLICLTGILAISSSYFNLQINLNFYHQKFGVGGAVGWSLEWLFSKSLGLVASLVFFLAIGAIGFILVLSELGKFPQIITEEKIPFPGKKELPKLIKKIPVSVPIPKPLIKKESPEITLISTRHFPKVNLPIDLLEKNSTKADSGDVRANKLIIQKTLENFGIPVEMGEVKIGPTVAQYTLKPAQGIKLSQITSLHNDLALSLASHPIRIEAPIPGQALVGIEVPNQQIAVVRLREILESENFQKRKSNLTIGLGKDVAGEIWLADLNKMPHLLVAGATGSGKTVMLNSIIIALLYQNPPQNLKFILIDPKRVELTLYNDLPHLLTPVITDVNKTINALKWSLAEMDRRFELFAKTKKRNLESYNEISEEKLPYIIIIIDELADLMIIAPQEIETCIIRLAQMSRVTGIHLIMATQRPSVDIITGLIKANITSRIAFSVASMTDSRTILDFSGAEKLLGRGDMLFVSPELSKPKRLQGAYISDQEMKKIVEYLRNLSSPEYVDGLGKEEFKDEKTFELKEDELLPSARQVVLEVNRASASLLQRRMRIGYARAARLLDLLEEEGTIGPSDGAKPRKILKQNLENRK